MVNTKIAKMITKYNLDFSGKNLTGLGGMILVREVQKTLGVCSTICECISVKQRERGYGEDGFVMSMVYNIISGGQCLNDLMALREDHNTQQLLDLDGVPHPSTAGLHLKQYTLGHLKQLEKALEKIQRRAREYETFDEVTIDIDSSIYAQASKNKSGSEKAYTGQVGYHPLLAFVEQTGELLHAKLRSGNTYTGKGAVAFIKKCLKKLRPDVHKRVRGDSGFYDENFLSVLEESDAEYTITAKQSGPLLDEILNLPESAWRPMPQRDGAEVAEFEYKTTVSEGYRRYVVKRELKDPDQERFDFDKYRYHIFVTNSARDDIAQLMEFHLDHANVENHIKEHKSGFDLEILPTGNFNANKAYFLIGQLAYNLICWLKSFFLPKNFRRATIKTIRHKFLFIAAKIVRRSRSVFIKLSNTYLRQHQFLEALNAIE